MHKYQLLRQRAEEFRRVLEEYAKVDPDVEDIKNWFQPWYERIQRREIRLPCYDYRLNAYFVNPDLSPLAERYFWGTQGNHTLAHVSFLFSEAMNDSLSDPHYLERIREAGEEPSAILTETPPQEEEVELAREESELRPQSSLLRKIVEWLRDRKNKP